VIKRIAPDAEVLDITHGIEPHSVLQGALVLANTLPYMPAGIHLAVVDPGVGGNRKGLILRGGGGRFFVGPDNGLLLIAAEKLGGVTEAVSIENEDYMLTPVSRTFHARDVFAPAAARLALGVPATEFGPALEPAALVRLELPRPEVGSARLRATVLYIDRFGNVVLNLSGADLAKAGIEPGTRLEVEVTFERYFAVAARTFVDVRPGDIVLYEDAYENVALAITNGNAADTFSVRVGQELRISRTEAS
jgi:S-adenosyl-L-methionine hydrolase (adenosine-forming)